MPQTADRWTADMVRALPDDGNRYEVIDGELFVTPSPTRPHQRAVRILTGILEGYVEANGVGEALASPADISWGPKRFVQPDVFVAPLAPDGSGPNTWPAIPDLLLAVEVLSPSTALADRQAKRRLYLEMGVPEYWVVDLDGRVVERWKVGDERPEILSQQLGWQPDPTVAALDVDLPSFFAKVWK